ncbi:lysophospholipid acyltransferase family protein [Candidatus Pelagibacter sp. Uisw_099_02]|uniref:lysophospholipid acyltransferase family protein n=1 Tax=Candidatus Pelagibacter sp. Uisw_099_02 TaxID=3230981 RepID=UPI0039E75FD1
MKIIKYFFQFLIIIFFFIIFKIIGFKFASYISSKIISIIGPFFRSKKIITLNIQRSFPNLSKKEIDIIINKMWNNYGRILSEYMFIKNFKKSKSTFNLEIKGQAILDEIKNNHEPVIFVSGHFNNFELMAMHIEKSGIDLAVIYRPLNNKFLNFIMEKIRKKYICKKQIKKGIGGTKKLLSFFKKGTSIALMIDQRVSEGIKCNFFNNEAFTTTIPAQFVKKFNCKIVPVYIERINNINFKLTLYEPLKFSTQDTTLSITQNLNNLLEDMIKKNPDQWIWSHNRWK